MDLTIFDCDGVLIDSEALAIREDIACLAEQGIAITQAEIMDRYVGVSMAEMVSDIEARHRRQLPGDFSETLRRRIAAAFEAELAVMPGLAGALDAAPGRICVASSSTPERLRHALALVGLLARFDPHIFSATQVACGKPAPDLFLFAAERMEVEPARCLVIEDSIAGVRAARAAGMIAIGFCGGSHCGPRHGADLLAAGAQAAFAHMDRLAEFLTKLRSS